MSTTLSLLVCLILASGYLQHCATVSIQDSWTLVDNEGDDDINEEQGSGDSSDDYYLGWVKHTKIGDVIVAKPPDIQSLEEYIEEHSALDDGTADFASSAPQEMEDGPVLTIVDGVSSKSEERRSIEEEEDSDSTIDCVEEIYSIHYYPEYAIGLLDNGCTAFLVGPHHAMTSAYCVYKQDERYWEENLDLWRGRHYTSYLQKMEWESVMIPREFFNTGDKAYNWAIITFTKSSASRVWLNFAYSPKPVSAYVTKYGYNESTDGVMVSKICEGNKEEESVKLLNVDCCKSEQTMMNGGPVLKGYSFNRSKMPHVCGISSSDKLGEEYSIAFHSDVFWSACYLLGISGYKPNCSKV